MLTRRCALSQRPASCRAAELAVCATAACSRGRRSLSNDVPVSDVERSEDVNGASPNGSGVLANLPRARPQRSSARRVAARESPGPSNGAGTTLDERRPASGERTSARAKRVKATRTPTREGVRKPAKRPAQRAVAPVDESAASAAAKRSAAGAASEAARPKARPAKRASARTTRKRPRPAEAQEPAPRQGFESESDAPTGSVQPPGGVELVASAAELVGELAKAGLSKSERLLKDVFSRLPLA